jgi:putative oxidoreductase
MKNLSANSLQIIAAVLLILLFGYTAVSKILEYDKFVFQLKLVQMPAVALLAPLLGILIPVIELVIVWMLCKDNLRIKGLYASFLLLLVFEIYITTMLLTGEKLPCTCGGIISQMGWKTHLVFNAVFMIISILPTIYKPKSRIFSGYHE